MEDSKESFGSGTDMSRLSSFELALASSPFSDPSKQASVFTEFGDSDCGEPLESHHLRLNFRPTDDDDDFSQRKCCEFWKYINSRRDLQGLMVRPEVPRSRPDTDIDSVKPCTSERRARPKTAVSMLQIVEKKGLIDRAFEGKMQQSRCSMGSHEYELGDAADKTKCSCPGPCLKCPNMATFNAQALCEELQIWDVVHPKSTEPPCHPASVEKLSSASGIKEVTRKYLYEQIKEQNLPSFSENLEKLENNLLECYGHTEESKKNLIRKFSNFKAQIKQRRKSSTRTKNKRAHKTFSSEAMELLMAAEPNR